MTIPEAIEILEKAVEATSFVGDHPLRHAQRLGIKALKFRLLWEQQEGEDNFQLLPGETKEQTRPLNKETAGELKELKGGA